MEYAVRDALFLGVFALALFAGYGNAFFGGSNLIAFVDDQVPLALLADFDPSKNWMVGPYINVGYTGNTAIPKDGVLICY